MSPSRFETERAMLAAEVAAICGRITSELDLAAIPVVSLRRLRRGLGDFIAEVDRAAEREAS